jgi:hypothetical protein
MRLPRLDRAHSWYVRAFFALARRVMGRDPPDLMKTLYYRPGFFGMRYAALAQEIMRGESPWTVGERELFAAYTSSLNQCVF